LAGHELVEMAVLCVREKGDLMLILFCVVAGLCVAVSLWAIFQPLDDEHLASGGQGFCSVCNRDLPPGQVFEIRKDHDDAKLDGPTYGGGTYTAVEYCKRHCPCGQHHTALNLVAH
jgi:hypothetical protein